MNQMKDLSAVAHILEQAMNESQGLQTRTRRLSEILQPLQEVVGEDVVARGYAERMTTELGRFEAVLTDLLSHLRQIQSQSVVGSGPSAVDSMTSSKRILVVDDERSVVELVERILRARGYQVDTVCNGHTAIRMTESQFYDLIIADLKMPDIGGMDVYSHIEDQNPEQARRVVFFSGDVVSPHTTAFLERIGLPFLVKPFTVRELVNFVEQAMA
ncbi:MAG: response regulator [Acidobacteria bacterium]|nr:response regulator [Acidobacteriota bacterium]